jgi:hypothetical protein
MSQTQTRKQKILGDVKRKRRQRAIISITIAVALIAIIVAAVIFLRPPPNSVSLPDYLSHCVNSSLFYHSHPNLTITINGANVPIADNTFNASCSQPLHTHDASGVIHVETDQNRDYTLHDWFLLWGYFVNDPNFTIFNGTQIFTYKVDPTHIHHLTMTVDGVNDTSFENHVFPRNASPTGGVGGSGLCAAPLNQPCVKDNIVITYG